MPADPMKSPLVRLGLEGGRGLAAIGLSLGLLILAAFGEAPRLALRWSRPDIAAGEAWRLVTGHLVHLDLEHALLNVAGLLLVWALFSRVFTAGQWALTLLAGVVAIDLGLWVVNVDLQWYVGASGLLHTAMAAGIVRQMLARDVLAWVLGVLGVGKLLYEHFSGAMPFTASGAMVVTDAHLYGAVAGMICGVVLRRGDATLSKRVASPL
jgi:rhomboid family GlyGly-CTERM serine protease